MYAMLVTLDTSHLKMSPLNADAEWNMPHMLVTLDTSQSEMSPVNFFPPVTLSRFNNWLISVTSDTSQDPIRPRGPLEQSVDSCRHSRMADCSLALNPVMAYYFRGHTIALQLRVPIIICVRVGDRVRVMMMLGNRGRARVRTLASK